MRNLLRCLRALCAVGSLLSLATLGCSSSPGSLADAAPDAGATDAAARDAAAQDAARDAGTDLAPADGPIPDAGEPRVGPLVEMPLLAVQAPKLPFNHSAEVTVAARGGHVVVASINMRFESASTFATTGFHKRVAVVTSHDNGDSFGLAIDPALGDQTTDPVVRVDANGVFYLASWDTNSFADTIGKSTDHGEHWTTFASPSFGDKPWIAVGSQSTSLFVGGTSRLSRYATKDGALLGQTTEGGGMSSAVADGTGVRFLVGASSVLHWTGTGSPQVQGTPLPTGKVGSDEINVCGSIGLTQQGAVWVVRATRSAAASEVVVRVRPSGGPDGSDVRISSAGKIAFMPAAATDAAGRLHVIWYESSGAGELRYARSKTASFADGFDTPLTIDANAYPGGSWYPEFDSASGGRRLREYIDIAVDQRRAHLVWTHAPQAPSRVYYAHVDFAL